MPVEMFSAAGKTDPGYCTGIGKAMLAFLPQDEQEKALKRQSFHRYTNSTLVDMFDLKSDYLKFYIPVWLLIVKNMSQVSFALLYQY